MLKDILAAIGAVSLTAIIIMAISTTLGILKVKVDVKKEEKN